MKLPDKLVDKFKAEAGSAPKAIARAMYDINGKLGETYLAANDHSLILFSKRVGSSYKTHHYALADIESLTIFEESSFTRAEISVQGKEIRLNLSSWDSVELEEIGQLWQATTGKLIAQTVKSDLTDDPVLEAYPFSRVEPRIALNPLIGFCASLYAIAEIDGHVEKGEMLVISRVISDPDTIQQGIKYLQQNGIHELLAQLNPLLNEDQKRCLLANVMAVAMEDGLLRSAEQEALGSFRQSLAVTDEDYEMIWRVLLNKNSIAVFAQGHPETRGISPLVGFCAALLALATTDDEVHQSELDFIQRVIDNPEPVDQGRAYLQRVGLDPLMAQLNDLLDEEQKLCLVANLLGVAMADGLLRGNEQELAERFRTALELTNEQYDTIIKVLMIKNNLGVFA